MKTWLPVVLLAVAVSCSAPPPKEPAVPPPPTITKATFEPLYRAAKSVQGATASGVTYVKFGELLQGFSTELAIVNDHQLNEADKKLLALFEAAFTHYQNSAALWKLKLNAADEMWKGEIPIVLDGKGDTQIKDATDKYGIPSVQRTIPALGKKYIAVPGDSPQRIWTIASAAVDEASKMFYGN